MKQLIVFLAASERIRCNRTRKCSKLSDAVTATRMHSSLRVSTYDIRWHSLHRAIRVGNDDWISISNPSPTYAGTSLVL